MAPVICDICYIYLKLFVLYSAKLLADWGKQVVMACLIQMMTGYMKAWMMLWLNLSWHHSTLAGNLNTHLLLTGMYSFLGYLVMESSFRIAEIVLSYLVLSVPCWTSRLIIGSLSCFKPCVEGLWWVAVYPNATFVALSNGSQFLS